MYFTRFPVVRFSFFLMLGIITAHYIQSSAWFYLLPSAIVLLFVAWLIARRQLFQKFYFGLTTYLCFFSIGLVNYQLRIPQFQAYHFSKHISEEKLYTLKLTVQEVLKPNSYSEKYLAEVLSLDERSLDGRMLLYLPKGDSTRIYSPGDKIIVQGQISTIKPPLNPHQFNYAAFMQLQNVYHEMRLDHQYVKQIPERSLSIKGYGLEIREQMIRKLDSSVFGSEEKSIIQALILGQRNDIDPNLYRSYAAAGAIHILAVSGLHVGIIYFLLLTMLRPLRWLPFGKHIRIVLLVILLWGYAILTGLSPSVTRAVTMFSFFALAQLLNRPTNSINTLFLSLFFLLIWNPKWLLHVGFQLSYVAVFFILWIQPILHRIYTPKFYLDKMIWSILTVSVAAQLGVAPLSIYYFNQFPGLFLLSNLVILPFLSLLVCFGIVIVILLSLDLLPDWLAATYNYLIGTLNRFVSWVATQDAFLFQEIHFSFLILIGTYVLIIGMLRCGYNFSTNRFRFALGSLLIFLLVLFLNKFRTTVSDLTIFHKTGESLITIRQGHELKLLKGDTSIAYSKKYPIRDYRTAIGSKDYSEEKLPDILSYKGRIIIVIDSTSVYPRAQEVAMVLLRDNPKIHLDRLIDSLQPGRIIADGSNYRSFVKRWRKTCIKRKLLFHFTGDRGAFILE